MQRTALKAAGCDVIPAEKANGTRRDGRTELQVLLDFLRPGDALVITRIDRLAYARDRGWPPSLVRLSCARIWKSRPRFDRTMLPPISGMGLKPRRTTSA